MSGEGCIPKRYRTRFRPLRGALIRHPCSRGTSIRSRLTTMTDMDFGDAHRAASSSPRVVLSSLEVGHRPGFTVCHQTIMLWFCLDSDRWTKPRFKKSARAQVDQLVSSPSAYCSKVAPLSLELEWAREARPSRSCAMQIARSHPSLPVRGHCRPDDKGCLGN
jgi:hypothetical protein